MDGIQLPQGYRATARRNFFFTAKLPLILGFPKNLLQTIFQFSRIDSKFWCDVFRDLWKTLMEECYFWSTKKTLLHGCFLRF